MVRQALQPQLDTPEPSRLEYQAHRYTQPARGIRDGIDLKTFWWGAETLPAPEEGAPNPGGISAVLIKKQGDYPAFWERDDFFLSVMEEIYQWVAVKNRGIL